MTLRAKEKAMREILKQSSKELTNTWTQLGRRTGLGLTVGALVYGVAYTFLRKRKITKKSVPSKENTIISTTSKSSENGWILNLLIQLLSYSLPKKYSYYLKKLLPFLTKKRSNLLLSLLVAILPWLLRFLFGAYDQERSQTSS